MNKHQFVKLWLVVSLSVLIAAQWVRHALPEAAKIAPQLLEEPIQEPLSTASSKPFQVQAGGVEYTINPLYRYDLRGVVVSMHDSQTFWDHLHREWNDHLNIVDLCVVWGDNVKTDNYRALDYSSGQFECIVQTRSNEAWQAFAPAALSNNHLITDQAAFAKAMRGVRIGDQVHFTGYLAEYSHNAGMNFKRGTSTTRTDTGNGACETVWIDSFEILKRSGGPWRVLFWLAVAMLVTGVAGWFVLPVGAGD